MEQELSNIRNKIIDERTKIQEYLKLKEEFQDIDVE